MSTEFQSVFARLQDILKRHARRFTVGRDTADHYSLEAPAGPATLRAWGGNVKRPMIPVAWVRIGKAYVSFHLVGVYGNTRLRDGMSNELKTRRQGKTCFNFKSNDEALFEELEQLTAQSIAGLIKAGYISQ